MNPQSVAAIALVALFISAPLMAPVGGSTPSEALSESAMAAAPEAEHESFWHNGSFGSDDRSLLRMLDHVGAMPAPTDINSHVLRIAAPAQDMPALYEALALSSDSPLQDAVLAYHEALDLLSPDELAGHVDAASQFPIDAQVAIAVLLYALTDASLLQKQAVAGLTAREYTDLVAVPGALQTGDLDPRDQTAENQAALAAVHDILSKVDGTLIDQAGLLVTHATTHAMPDLHRWSQREQAIKESPNPRLDAIAGWVDAYPRNASNTLDPIGRLSILADAVAMVAGIHGIDLDRQIQPLAAPDGLRPLRAALLDLMGALGGVDSALVSVDGALEAELARADALPRSLQVAAAQIIVNQAGLVRAQLEIHAVTSSDPELARSVREAELRVIRAVQQSAPTIEAWGLLWSHHGQALLPTSPADSPGKLGDLAALGQQVTDAHAGLHEVMQLAGQLNGLTISKAETPPLPARGALGDAVLSLYARYGIAVEEDVRANIVAGAEALPPEVERNAARILLAQLDALGVVEDREALLQGDDNPDRAHETADAVGRLLAGEPIAVDDVRALRAHYAAIDEAQAAMMQAAAALAAALDASASELEVWAGYSAPPAPDVPQRAPKKAWYEKAWSAVKDFQIIGTASAQTIQGEFTPDVPCPNSPLAACDLDIWFMDPILETVVVSGIKNTVYDPTTMRKAVSPAQMLNDVQAACKGATPDAADSVCNTGAGVPSLVGVYPRGQMLSLDLGGRDTYHNNAGGSSPAFTSAGLLTVGTRTIGPFVFAHPTAVSVAIDLGGQDEYLRPKEFLTDLIGSQTVAGLQFPGATVPGGAQGAGLGGIGILWDRRGNDRYEADEMAQGFGSGEPMTGPPGITSGITIGQSAGIGILIDGDGRDEYEANEYAQGVGYREGSIGILMDLGAGLDSYMAKDNAQGAGIQSGIGILVDSAGDTTYELNVGGTGQGGARTNCPDGSGSCPEDEGPLVPRGGVGILIDGSGNDEYAGGQQGRGPHGLSLGVLVDADGQDTYDRPDETDGTSFDDGTCWTSFRPTSDVLNTPPLDTYAEVTRRTGTSPGQYGRGIFVDYDSGCDVEFLLPPAPDHEQFIKDRQDDASDDDQDGHAQMVEEQAGTDASNGDDYPVGAPQALELDDDGVPTGSPWLVRLPGLFVLGDVTETLYPACSDPHEALEETSIEFSSSDGLITDLTAAITFPSCEYFVSLDLAGNDEYHNGAGSSLGTSARAATDSAESPVAPLAAILVDVLGDDVYTATSRCAQGCGGFLIDLAGDDRYEVGEHGGQGLASAPLAGLETPTSALPVQPRSSLAAGILFDASGNDRYKAHEDSMAQGGVHLDATTESHMAYRFGILLDASGDDTYDAPTQGVVDADPLIGQGELPALLDSAIDSPPVALFVDLDGADSYQPVGRQADARTGMAGFVDAGGQDRYVGTPGNPDGPDRSRHHNNWMRFDPAAGANWNVDNTLPAAEGRLGGGTSIFIDSARDDTTTLLDGSYGSGFGVGPLRTEPGTGPTGGDNRYLDDYTLLIDPGGDDQYLNNAGATRLRPDMPTGTLGAAQYDPTRNHPLASLLIDLAGDDRYESQSRVLDDEGVPEAKGRGLLTQGAAFLGAAMLVDHAGNDIYTARSQSQGFSLRGVGVLWDRAGDDTYSHDTALLRRPLADRGIVAWEEFVHATDNISPDNVGAVNAPAGLGWGTDGAWIVKGLDTNGGCTPFGQVPPHVDGTIIQDGRIATSTFDPQSGAWRVIKGHLEECEREVTRVSASESNQVNPVFARFVTFIEEPERVLWQDDRDGTWSLYHKAVSASTNEPDTELMNAREHNQINPHSYGLNVVYQDDEGCQAGEWRIRMVFQPTQDIQELAACGAHASPRISQRFIAWQTQDEKGDSEVVVVDRNKDDGDPDRMRIITLDLPGEHRGPVVSETMILYTSKPEPGRSQVMRYDWATDESSLVRDHARDPSIEGSSSPMRAAWLDTLGDEGGAEAIQVYHRPINHPPHLRGEQRASVGTASQYLQGATAFGGAGVLFDEQGQDTYRGDRFAQGASSGGVAGLVDADGNDAYRVRGPGQAAAQVTDVMAHALLLDVRGNDAYFAKEEAQGFRSASGPGSLAAFLDLGGADLYQYPASLLQAPLAPCLTEEPGHLQSQNGLARGCIALAEQLELILSQLQDVTDLLDQDDVVQGALALVADSQAAVEEEADLATGPAGRNNAVWLQPGPTPENPGPNPDAIREPDLSDGIQDELDDVGMQVPLTPRSGGVDAPLFETANRALRELATRAIDVTVEVHDPEGTIVGGESNPVHDEASMVAKVEVDGADFAVERVEYLTGIGSELTFLGYADNQNAPEEEGSILLYRRAWDTTSGAYPDGEYTVQVRVHYRYGVEGTSTAALGYIEGEAQVRLDNVPRIINLATGNTTFSPFPFSADAPGIVEYDFSVPEDPFLRASADRDAWVRVQVLQNDQVLRELLHDAIRGGLQGTWDGHDAQGNVQSGTYSIRISVTDRQPSGGWDPQRTDSIEFPVRIHADTPTAGCVRFAQGNDVGECNAGATVNLENSQAQSGQAVQFELELGLEADSGLSERRYHMFVGSGDPIEWQLDRSLEKGANSLRTSLTIADGQSRHVLILGEDDVGNLECMPSCGGLASDSVHRGGTPQDIEADLRASLDRKLAWADGIFPGGWPEAGQPVFATFTADLSQPVISDPTFAIDGQKWEDGINDGPRLNGTSNFTLSYVLFDAADFPPEPRMEWTNEQVNDVPSAQRLFTIPEVARIQSDLAGHYNVSWAGWADLVADWPDGLLFVDFDGRDAAGNRPLTSFRGNVILDRVAPTLSARVEYPPGQFHAETGQEVQVFVTGSDPLVENAARDLKLVWRIDPSNVTSADPGANCILRFDCTRGDERFTTVPISESFDHPQVMQVVVKVRDTAGNTNQTLVPIQVGAPQLHPAIRSQDVGVFSFDTAWATDAPTNATLEYWKGTASSEPLFAYSNTSATHHSFSLNNLLPGTQYSYRVLVENATDPTGRQLSDIQAFHTKFGVTLNVLNPADGAVLSGVHTVHGSAGVLADQAIEPRITMRLHGPGLPPTGRVLFDDTTDGGSFTLNFVTEALEDGAHELNVTASHLGEAISIRLADLLVDNKAPELALVAPTEGAITSVLPDNILVRVAEIANPIDVQGAQLIIDGNPVAAVSREYIYDEPGLQNGVLRFTVTHPAALDPEQLGARHLEVVVGDLAGNLGRASTRFTYDPQAPSVSSSEIIYPDGQQAARPGQWIKLRVQASDNHTGVARTVANMTALGGIEEVALPREGADYAVDVRISNSLQDGLFTVPIHVIDAAGNRRLESAVVVVDATPPHIEQITFTETGASSGKIQVNASEPVTAIARIPGLATVKGDAGQVSNQAIVVHGLRPGKDYIVNVTVQDEAGHKMSSDATWRFLPDLGPAPSVDNLTATTGLGVARLDWDALDGFRYAVHRAHNGSFQLMATVTERHYVDATVVPGGSFRYFVQSLDAADRPGRASIVVEVTMPEQVEATRLEAVDVRPRTGLAEDTVFVFTAMLEGAQQADPPAWLIFDDGARRMRVAEGEDCRIRCTLEHATRLPAITMRDATPQYHVEIDDATQFLRMPETGELAGPTVFSTGAGPASPSGEKATPLPILSMLTALGAALVIRRLQ